MNSTQKTIRLKLDYLQGPIWVSDFETGEPLTGVEAVDRDPVLKELNRQAGQLFSSYYEINSHGVACWFNHEKQKAEKEQMLSLIQRICTRLDEINDGSFTVEDCVSEELKQL